MLSWPERDCWRAWAPGARPFYVGQFASPLMVTDASLATGGLGGALAALGARSAICTLVAFHFHLRNLKNNHPGKSAAFCEGITCSRSADRNASTALCLCTT